MKATLADHGLPERWRGRRDFVMLDAGFDSGSQAGLDFIAAWAAWRQDPARCERLHYIAITTRPLCGAALAQAHASSTWPDLGAQLVAQWPPLTPGLHSLRFEGGRVVVVLAIGAEGRRRDLLRQLVAEVDAFELGEASGQDWDAHLLKSLARLASPGATVALAHAAPALRERLAAAGFASEVRTARFAPRHAVQRPAGREPLAAGAREAVVLGAGLAGAACAFALAQAGVACTVIDARPGPAQASSGNPGGLFHGTSNPDDGPHARFNRAAALATQAQLDALDLPGRQHGLLRLETRRTLAQMQSDLHGLPGDYAQALSAVQASAHAGGVVATPAWFYPGGGALDPGAYARALLAASGAALRLNCTVAALRQDSAGWSLFDASAALIARTPLLVLAGGHDQLPLLRTLAPDLAARLQVQRGQLSHIAQAPWLPALPVAGDGYVMADGQGGVWCGATSQNDDPEPELRATDHADNLARYARLAGRAALDAPLAGRVAWRLIAPDRLPLIGGLAAPEAVPGRRDDQLRLLARRPGLVLCTALASRGIGWAALAGQTAAALALGTPRPLPADLLDAVDPLRFALRSARSG